LCKKGERSIAWASLFLGLACLTRYEAWLITAVAGFHFARTRSDGRSLRAYLQLLSKTIALFGWAPLLWIVLHRGISPQGTYVLEEPATWERLLRIPYIVAMALYHAGPIVGCLALFGLLTFWRLSLWAKPGIQMMILAAALLMVSLVFSAHGVEPNPPRYVTDREAHWFMLFAFWVAALGLSGPIHRSNLRTVIHWLALILTVVWSLFQTDRYIKRLLADQNLILDYAVAQHLDQNLSDGDVALVFAQPLQANSAQQYLDKVYSQGGTQALAVARQQLADLNSGPLDYSRIVVNTHVRKGQIVDGSKLTVSASDTPNFVSQKHVRLAAVFSNYPAQESNTWHLLNYLKQRSSRQITLKDRDLQVSIYEVQF
jgi:hypothetical protein